MALDPNVQQVGPRPVELEDPLDLQRKRLMVEGAKQQNTLGSIHIEDARRKQAEADEDKADADTMSQEFTNPAHLDDKGRFQWDKYREAVRPKVKLRNLQRLDNDHRTEQQSAMALKNEEKISRALDTETAGNEIQALLSVPYEQRKALMGPALERLKGTHFDLEGYDGLDPSDENLRAMAARVGYYKDILSFDDKKELAKRRGAQAKREDTQAANAEKEETAKGEARDREAAATEYRAIGTSLNQQGAFDAWKEKWGKKYPALYSGIDQYDPKQQQTIDDFALSADKRNDNQRQRDRDEADRKQRDEQNKLGKERNDISRTRAQQVQRGETANQVEKDKQKADELNRQAKEHEDRAERLQAAVNRGNDANVINPLTNSGEITMNAAWRTRFAEEMMKAKEAAKGLRAEAGSILSRKSAAAPAPPSPASSGDKQQPQAWTVKGKQYKDGDPITINGEVRKFMKVGDDGKVKVYPKTQ